MGTMGGEVLEVGESLCEVEDGIRVCGQFRETIGEKDSSEDGKIDEEDQDGHWKKHEHSVDNHLQSIYDSNSNAYRLDEKQVSCSQADSQPCLYGDSFRYILFIFETLPKGSIHQSKSCMYYVRVLRSTVVLDFDEGIYEGTGMSAT